MPTYATFIIMFPEFADIDQAFIEVWLSNSSLRISSNIFLEMYALAVYYVTAHYLSQWRTLNENEGADSGVVSGESVGDLSVSYGMPNVVLAPSAGNYATTSYGREYIAIRNIKVIGMTAVGITDGF